jgi:hypothetical protein
MFISSPPPPKPVEVPELPKPPPELPKPPPPPNGELLVLPPNIFLDEVLARLSFFLYSFSLILESWFLPS